MLVGYLTEFCVFDCKFSLHPVRRNLSKHAMVILAVFSILWNFSSCGVVRMADYQEDDDRNWLENSPRRKPLEWYSITKLKPVEKENIHEQTPLLERNPLDSNEDKNLLKPPDPRTLPFQGWWWMTTSTATTPYNFDNIGGNTKMDGYVLFLMIFLIVGGVILIICKSYLCEERECTFVLCKELCDVSLPEDTTTSASSSRSSRATRLSERNRTGRQPLSTLENNSLSAESQRLSRRSDSSVINSVIDRPPGYSDVVLADFSAISAKFPGVKPTAPESPPPIYDEEIMKY